MSDDLDDLLRRAMQTLDDRVPPGYFDDFSRRMLARLGDDGAAEIAAVAPPPETAEAPPVAPAAEPREEDSGLHDIRSLASSQRLRISSARSSQSSIAPADEVLAAASGGWKAVALPEPAKTVSLPEPAAAAAAPGARGARVARTRRGWVAGVGLGVAAAAAAVLFVSVSSKSREDRSEQPRGEGAESIRKADTSSNTMGEGQLAPAPAKPAMIAVPEVAADAADAGMAAAGSAAAGFGSAEPVTSPPPSPVVEPKPTPVAPPPGKIKAGIPTKKPGKSVGKTASPEDASEPKVPEKSIEKAPEKPIEKPIEKPTPEPPKKKGDPGDPDIDKLLKDSGAPATKPAAKPERTQLSADDIKKAMGGVAAKVTACYAGTQGTAAVKLVVAPSGQIQKAVVSGAFAGTPVGTCVEAAVRGAVFPSWDGAPQTVSYSYLLSE